MSSAAGITGFLGVNKYFTLEDNTVMSRLVYYAAALKYVQIIPFLPEFTNFSTNNKLAKRSKAPPVFFPID